jgi:hypothetical protein
MATVRINIDGREIEAEETLNLIEAVRLLGINILTSLPPWLGVDGNAARAWSSSRGPEACHRLQHQGEGAGDYDGGGSPRTRRSSSCSNRSSSSSSSIIRSTARSAISPGSACSRTST